MNACSNNSHTDASLVLVHMLMQRFACGLITPPPTVLTCYEQRAFVHPCHHSDSCASKHWRTLGLISIPVSAPEAVCQPLCCALAAIFASAGPAAAPLLPEARAPQMSTAPEWQYCTP